jgi:hypothetical protein
MDWARDGQTRLSGALLVSVWYVHLCYENVVDSGDTEGLVAEKKG